MLCDLPIFSGGVYHPRPPHAQSLFLFPIVFGVNLIHFFDGKNNLGRGRHTIRSFVSGLRSLLIAPFDIHKVGTKSAIFFGNGKCELSANFSATICTILMVTIEKGERKSAYVW